MESREEQWTSIRMSYAALAVQMLTTVSIAFLVAAIRPIEDFIVSSRSELGLKVLVINSPTIVFSAFYLAQRNNQINLVILGFYTISFGVSIGLTCVFASGRIILETLILMTVGVMNLTIYTFWAARRGHDFSFVRLFVIVSCPVLIIFSLVQVLFPLGEISTMILGCLAATLLCCSIVVDTRYLMKYCAYE